MFDLYDYLEDVYFEGEYHEEHQDVVEELEELEED